MPKQNHFQKMQLLQMPKRQRYLITTADERTWKFDRPVVFLGEWCRLYDRKHIWRGMDATVAAPYGLGQARKDADYAEARALEGKLFPMLCDVLNRYHGTQHRARFWKIVFGHWFRRYVDTILNRVRTLELCFQTYQLNGTTVFSDVHYALAPLDSNAAIWAFNDDRWNNVLYSRILNLLRVTDCPVEVIAGDASEGFRWFATVTERPLKQRILMWGYRQAGCLAELLTREDDAFIVNSYLPRKVEISLQLALRQAPQLWATPTLKSTKKQDSALRHNLSAQMSGSTGSTLFGIMSSLVFELLPVCYLEGFAELTKTVNQLRWPKCPKFIFTSNDFDTNELFKLWVATKVESGCKYITGQHGNNYGTYRYMHPSIEEATADKFLTWGWTDGLTQHTPAFIFKVAGRKAKAYNPTGGLILIELSEPHRLTTWDGTFEFGGYFEDQRKFIENLQKAPREKLTIRLHSAYRYARWFEIARWHDFGIKTKLDLGAMAIRKSIAESRLVVHSYDSTGILETLSQNIPTLAFWQNDFDHLRDSAKPYYQSLVNAGIVHLTAESAASKVNEVWNDVEGWWTQRAVQDARKQFCDRYARISRNPISDLKKMLQE